MKRFLIFIGAFILCFSTLAQAELKVGLIDMRAALFSSDAAKEFTEDMVSKYKQQDLEVRAVGEDGQ
ncbi:MAG: outer membrane protein, partial [Oleiphilaceae bacterium]